MAAALPPPPGSPFGPANLPYGVFARAAEAPRVGARLGDAVLDLAALARAGLLTDPSGVFAAATLNPFMALGREAWQATRARLRELAGDPQRLGEAVVPLDAVELRLPFAVGDYVDFYSSRHHAANAGRIFRPGVEDPLPRNWRSLPVGYHGRAGTVVVSGTPVRRPHGQYLDGGRPAFGPTRALDVELELGFVVGAGSRHGERVTVERAHEHVFGVVLLNDWSARDLQAWESQPLGPFLGKSFATSISAWVVDLQALAPYRVPGEPQDPLPLDYLRADPVTYDLDLTVELAGHAVARTSARHLYWSVAQQVAHLTANGASLRTGDLLGSGTISGPARHERGSLLELSWGGSEPLELPDGSVRTYLEDGDEAVLSGIAGAGSADPVALGEVRGRIAPA